MNDFKIFKRFNDNEQAIELAEEFRKNGIECQLINDSPAVDITFTGNSTFQKETQLLIRQSDFEKANKIQEDQADEILLNINKDHYLFEFTNEELHEILEKPDEWNPIDYKLAQKLLKERGQEVNENLLKSLKQERINELSKPEKGQGSWIIIGYIFSLLGGFLGILIGWFLWTLMKTLPTGEKIYLYSENDRKHGKRIFIIGMIVFPVALIIKFFDKLNF
jgi:hypothetical protein